MRIVVTIVGKDRVGIIANMEKADLQLDKLKDVFTALGNEIGVEIRVQSEEIFTAMHRI